MDEALFVARELKLELAANETEIERLRRDALRYRWLNKYTSQLFMVTESQMNYEVDRAMSGSVK
jgi:1,2-phenylacetyl-CoA epoxidase catalytic subunit